jgi:hypothetical protein
MLVAEERVLERSSVLMKVIERCCPPSQQHPSYLWMDGWDSGKTSLVHGFAGVINSLLDQKGVISPLLNSVIKIYKSKLFQASKVFCNHYVEEPIYLYTLQEKEVYNKNQGFQEVMLVNMVKSQAHLGFN